MSHPSVAELAAQVDSLYQEVWDWRDAIKVLYREIPGKPGRVATWATDLVFPLPCKLSEHEANDVDDITNRQKWHRIKRVLCRYRQSYRLGYATQILLNLPVIPEKATEAELKEAIAANKGIRDFLLLFDYIHRSKGREPDEKARTLCQRVYARFFHEGFADDNMDEPGNDMKVMLDQWWEDVRWEEKHTSISTPGPNGETYFCLGMEGAAKDLQGRLQWWETLNDDEWAARYWGTAWMQEHEGSGDKTTDEQREEE